MPKLYYGACIIILSLLYWKNKSFDKKRGGGHEKASHNFIDFFRG